MNRPRFLGPGSTGPSALAARLAGSAILESTGPDTRAAHRVQLRGSRWLAAGRTLARLSGMPRALWLSLTSLLTACSFSGEGDPPQVVESKIDEYIESLPYLAVDAAAVQMGDPSQAQSDGDYSCTTQNLKETRQYDRIVAYAANSDS